MGHTGYIVLFLSGNKRNSNYADRKGLQINAVDKFGNTPLALACIYANKELVEFLAAAGGIMKAPATIDNLIENLELLDTSKHLGEIVRNLQITISPILPWQRIEREESMLEVAASNGSAELLAVLTTFEKEIEAGDQKLLNALLKKAVSSKNELAINFLLTHGTQIDFQDSEGDTILHVVSTLEEIKPLQLVLNFNPNVDIRNKNGDTALHAALQVPRSKLNLGIIELLVKKGAQCHIRNNLELNALHLAAKRNSKALAIILSQNRNSLDIDQTGPTNLTALHYACLSGKVRSVKRLIDAGAKLTRDKGGLTPLHHAVINCATLEKSIFYTSNQHLKKNRKSLEIIDLLIQKTALIDSRSHQGWTPLHIASSSHIAGYFDRSYYRNWNYVDRGKNTSLEAINLLIREGANINCQDNNGWTPLHFAVFDNSAEKVSVLLDNGADTNLESKEEMSPRDLALIMNNASILELFNISADESQKILSSTRGNELSAKVEKEKRKLDSNYRRIELLFCKKTKLSKATIRHYLSQTPIQRILQSVTNSDNEFGPLAQDERDNIPPHERLILAMGDLVGELSKMNLIKKTIKKRAKGADGTTKKRRAFFEDTLLVEKD